MNDEQYKYSTEYIPYQVCVYPPLTNFQTTRLISSCAETKVLMNCNAES